MAMVCSDMWFSDRVLLTCDAKVNRWPYLSVTQLYKPLDITDGRVCIVEHKIDID